MLISEKRQIFSLDRLCFYLRLDTIISYMYALDLYWLVDGYILENSILLEITNIFLYSKIFKLVQISKSAKNNLIIKRKRTDII